MNDRNRPIELKFDTIKDSSALFHSETELVYVVDGTVEVTINSTSFRLSKDDMVVVNSSKMHSTKHITDGLICRFLMNCDLFTDGTVNQLPVFWCNTRLQSSEYDAELRTLIHKLLRRHLVVDSDSDLQKISLYYQLAAYLASHYLVSAEKIRSEEWSDQNEERVRKALLYIHSNYARPLTLNELADHLHLTSAYLSRYLKKYLGTNFKEYTTRIRLNYAVEDLLYSHKSVLRVAIDNGFANLAMFNKTFKDVYNATPTEYKKRMKDQVDTKLQDRTMLETRIKEDLERTLGMESSTDMENQAITATESVSGGVPFKRPWAMLINAGALSDMLNSEIQKHLLVLRQYLDFKYVRMWGIFPETITAAENGEFHFNFSRLDHAISFLVQNGMKPFLQLGPKIRTIISTIGTTVYVNASGKANPKEYDDERWQQYIDMMMRHFVAQFGTAEVESWIFEMWHPAPWDKPWENWYSDAKFECLYSTVKQYAPRALVGGCEYERHIHVSALRKSVRYWREHGIQPDFLSFQLFPYVVPDVNDVSSLKTITEADFFYREVKEMRREMDSLGHAGTKLFITLWNMTISNRNILNDTCFKGAWIMKNMLDIADIVDMAGYWVASDVYGEAYDSTSALFGGSGLITKNGIFKPAYHVLRFMHKALATMVVKRSNYVITKGDSSNYTILFHNMKTINIQPFLRREEGVRFEDLKLLFEGGDSLKLKITLTDVTPGKYYIRTSSVSKLHGSVLDVVLQWNNSIEPKHDDNVYLQKICIPHVDIQFRDAADGSLTLELDIEPNEFGKVEIMPLY